MRAPPLMRRRRRFHVVGARSERAAQSAAQGRRPARGAVGGVRRPRSAETGATLGWGHFNVHFAADLLREAAAMTTQVTGEVSRRMCRATWPWPSVSRRASCWDRAVERRDHPGRARGGDAARVRQHRHPEGLGNLPRDAPADRRRCCSEAGLGDGVVNVVTTIPRMPKRSPKR